MVPPLLDALDFVAHKQQASRLRGDFRLQLGGLLKSWAVPKGPSLNPNDKRLAGLWWKIIPWSTEGYWPRARMVLVRLSSQDQGTYRPLAGSDTRAATQEQVRAGLDRGSLHFLLYGEKLRGEFTLIRMRRLGENAWLLPGY